jgi:hypothetical protein
MDDFNGSYCNRGAFPLIRRLSECFRKAYKKENKKPTTNPFLLKPTEAVEYHNFDEIKFSVLNSNTIHSASACKKEYLIAFLFFSLKIKTIFY